MVTGLKPNGYKRIVIGSRGRFSASAVSHETNVARGLHSAPGGAAKEMHLAQQKTLEKPNGEVALTNH